MGKRIEMDLAEKEKLIQECLGIPYKVGIRSFNRKHRKFSALTVFKVHKVRLT